MIIAKKLTFEDVKLRFEARGYELLETEYKNSTTKMKYKCLIHHDVIQEINVGKLSIGRGCRFCGKERSDQAKRADFEDVNKAFKKLNLILLTEKKDYRNNKQKLKFKCNKHSDVVQKSDYATIASASIGCKLCKYEFISQKRKLDYQHVKDFCLNKGLILLQNYYKNNSTKIKLSCIIHNDMIFYIDFDHIRSGQRCPRCTYESVTGEHHYNWKGGISDIQEYLRGKLSSWKLDILKLHDYKCNLNKRKQDLEVHHLTSMKRIINDALNNTDLKLKSKISDYTNDELNLLEKEVLSLHNLSTGVPLRKKYHLLFHKLYGYHDTTPDDYKEFKIRFNMGEFNNLS